jgi:phosphocarrier protein
MKRSQVAIGCENGLHLRLAARLVKRARSFQSRIFLKVGQQVADARSIVMILLLCGSVGTVVDVEVSGNDEDEALAAIESVLASGEPDSSDQAPMDATGAKSVA